MIFSFWKKTLDILAAALEARRIEYLRVDGDVPVRKRGTILHQFQNREASRVLLITFSTGAVGYVPTNLPQADLTLPRWSDMFAANTNPRLNGLTVANMVHILEPQWNPAVENQAIGRLLRLDQQSRVTVFRYVMQRSIEEVGP